MRLDELSGRNDEALRLIRSVRREQPAIAPPDSVERPHDGQGSHPDVVDRVWDELGGSLPRDCRCLVSGTPALVHPATGVLIAFTLGTGYFVRLPSAAAEDPATERAAREVGWDVEAARELGAAWVVGSWSTDEVGWLERSG